MCYLGVINRNRYLTWDVFNLVLGKKIIKTNSHSCYDVNQGGAFLHKPQLLLIIPLVQVCPADFSVLPKQHSRIMLFYSDVLWGLNGQL